MNSSLLVLSHIRLEANVHSTLITRSYTVFRERIISVEWGTKGKEIMSFHSWTRFLLPSCPTIDSNRLLSETYLVVVATSHLIRTACSRINSVSLRSQDIGSDTLPFWRLATLGLSFGGWELSPSAPPTRKRLCGCRLLFGAYRHAFKALLRAK